MKAALGIEIRSFNSVNQYFLRNIAERHLECLKRTVLLRTSLFAGGSEAAFASKNSLLKCENNLKVDI
jgi:hypothetical protein